MEKKVTVIPARKDVAGIKKVGIYCRVSSPSSAQLHSLAAQASYLTKYVMSHIGWRIADIYIDVESGSSTFCRAEFNRMIEDAKKGIIDQVVTKSISRFGRNAEDVLTAVHLLSSHSVHVYFEEQSIDSRSPESELYITLFSGIAQEENRSLSENIKWGIRKKIEDGSSPIYDRPCYGYRVDENGAFTIVPEEATVVRRIFAMYLSGMSILKIKATLEADGIMSPTGKSNWSKRTIDMILSNKKYCGFSVAKGEKGTYERENHHEPIITLDLFEKVQTTKIERTNVEIDEDGKRHRKSQKYSSQKSSNR